MQGRVGQQFGNYRLTALIGVGGYSDVYLAEHAYIAGLQHAIKVLKGTDLEEYNQDEFLREARTIANLQRFSPYIVHISDVGVQAIEEGGATSYVPYIVMEYAPCGTLRSLYPHGTQVPLERIIFYTKQIAQALQCAHDQDIIHRDVKPENMLLRTTDHVLLSDFGISISGKTGLLKQPKERDVVGTAAYIAPERFSSFMRRASDQYSLGIVVYEWISGTYPFDGTNEQILAQHVTVPPPPLYPTYPHVTPELSEVIAHALAKKPDDRYPTVQAFADALERAGTFATQVPPTIAQPLQGQSIATASVSQTIPAPISSIEATASAPAVPTTLPIDHKNQLPKITTPIYVSNTIQTTVPRQPLSTQHVVANPVRPPLNRKSNVFEFSSRFANNQRHGLFINTGTILNVASAIIMSFLMKNVFMMFIALIVSWALFTLCIYAVEEKLALFFAILLALYWAYVGYVIGQALASLLSLKTSPPAFFVSSIFLLVSLGLHIRYILHKNL